MIASSGTNSHLYNYCSNNPIKYTDPDGKCIDAVLDIAGVIWDIAEVAATPANPWAWASLAADVGCIFIPGATGGGKIIKAIESSRKFAKASKAARLANVTDFFVDAVKSGERIFGKYKDMKKVTAGYNHAIEAHHLVPQALDKILEKNVDDFASVVIDQATHWKFSDRWNKALKDIYEVFDSTKDIKAVKAKILKHAKDIYNYFPEMLDVTKAWLDSF